MRLVSWNVNSVRARRERVVSWIEQHSPDVVLLQETKCADDAFMGPEGLGDCVSLGYELAHHGLDHWNGVAVLSRVGMAEVQKGFPGTNRAPFDEARLLSATCAGVRVHSVYAPNGRALDNPHYLYKLVWLERLRAAIDPARPTIVAGDFNVAPSDLDIYDPVRWRRHTHASPPERDAIQALIDLGLVDVVRRHLAGPGVFTWWSYRPGQFTKNNGLRIDLALCTHDVADGVRRVAIDTEERAGSRPSDHAPLVLDLG